VAARAIREGRHEEAAEILTDVARRSPDVEPQFLLGLALSGAGRHAEALQAFESVRARHLIYQQAALYVFRPWAEVLSAEALDRLERHAEARARVAAFLEDWKAADPDLPLLAQARAMNQRMALR
jgi:tetratricopeptide (TPR) repeat protein